jgi:hypothetical protein
LLFKPEEIRVRAFVLMALLAIVPPLALAGCSDSVAPSRARPTNTGNTPPPAAEDPPHTGPWRLAVNHAQRDIAVGDSVRLDARLLDSRGRPVDVKMTWSISDSSLVAVAPDSTGAWMHALSPGWSVVVVNAPTFAASAVVVVVLPRTDAAPTVIVDDFRMLAVRVSPTLSNFWYYAPRLSLHDTSSGGGSAVIGVQLEVPGQFTTPWCSTRRDVDASGRQLFHIDPLYPYPYEWDIPGSGVPPGSSGPAVAHLTVRTPDGYAATMTVTGPIEIADPPTADADDSISESEQLLCE